MLTDRVINLRSAETLQVSQPGEMQIKLPENVIWSAAINATRLTRVDCLRFFVTISEENQDRANTP